MLVIASNDRQTERTQAQEWVGTAFPTQRNPQAVPPRAPAMRPNRFRSSRRSRRTPVTESSGDHAGPPEPDDPGYGEAARTTSPIIRNLNISEPEFETESDSDYDDEYEAEYPEPEHPEPEDLQPGYREPEFADHEFRGARGRIAVLRRFTASRPVPRAALRRLGRRRMDRQPPRDHHRQARRQRRRHRRAGRRRRGGGRIHPVALLR